MRLGIVGCGLIGQKRAKAAGAHEIRVVADGDAGRARALAAATGATAATDWRDVISADLDAVVIATPHDLLAPIALAAVQKGKHVLVEKPAARSATEFAPVVRAAERAGTVVAVGYNHRFHPGIAEARRIAAAGEIGPLMFVRARYGHGGRLGYEREWRANRAVSGGGELVDQGTHLIDLARWLLGPLALDYAHAPTLFWNMEVEDNCFMALRNETGALAWLHASWTEWKNMFSLEIYGRTGKLVVEGLGGSYGPERLTVYRMGPEMGPPQAVSAEYPGPDLSWEREFDSFARAASGGASEAASMHDGLEVLKIVESVYERSRP
jgi:predicted dehydrogenase